MLCQRFNRTAAAVPAAASQCTSAHTQTTNCLQRRHRIPVRRRRVRTATAALPGFTLDPVRLASAALPSALSWPAYAISMRVSPLSLSTSFLPLKTWGSAHQHCARPSADHETCSRHGRQAVSRGRAGASDDRRQRQRRLQRRAQRTGNCHRLRRGGGYATHSAAVRG